MTAFQTEFPFEGMVPSDDNLALWTPRDIWVKLTQRLLSSFSEGRRVEYKGGKRVDFDDVATYLSAFSNTVDGGVIVFGANSDGVPEGCSSLGDTIVNRIESCHLILCPQAKPECRRLHVKVGNSSDFCIAIYIPYVGKLVETNKGEAWIRYGDNRHKMTDEEKRDFRSTRQERSFETDISFHKFPEEFNLGIVQDYCDRFREREGRYTWTNEEVLCDRRMATKDKAEFKPHNNLVLLAGLNPRKTIPGCRVRVQRFSDKEEGVGGGRIEYSPIRDQYIEGNIVDIIR